MTDTSPQSIITDSQSNLQIIKDVSSNLISSLSGGMFSFAMGLMLLHDTKSPLSFGLETIISPIVSLLFLVPVGNLVDKYKHKFILVSSILLRIIFLLIFSFSINMFFGIYKLIPVAIFVTINSISTNFSTTAYSASVHELVNDKKIQKLSSLSQSASALSSILAPVLGVALYALIGFRFFIFIEIIATLVSFAILLTMNFYYEKRENYSKTKLDNAISGFSNFKNGLTYIKERPLIKNIVFVAVVINFLFTAITVGMPFMIVTRLHDGNGPVGYIETGFAFGLLLGSLLMSILPSDKYLFFKFSLPLPLMGVSMALLGLLIDVFHDPLRISLYGFLIVMLSGFMNGIFNVAVNAKLQTSVPTHILGRVVSILVTAVTAIMPVGTLFYTFLFQKIINGSNILIFSGIFLFVYAFIFGFSIYRDVITDSYSKT
ncbi:MFS transporter [Oenococcus oeni]|uniref:MFS transporter n=1 Tax=Oenococcus oeni TaxID=1247 RepID=UPI0010B0A62E|nr:MFS transporter [Oenococcus oeni]SYW08711.1 Permease of the major facilitator superfamily [Oenococcus oeni]